MIGKVSRPNNMSKNRRQGFLEVILVGEYPLKKFVTPPQNIMKQPFPGEMWEFITWFISMCCLIPSTGRLGNHVFPGSFKQ